MHRRDGLPLLLADNEPAITLHRADLSGKSETESYSETWLQRLLYESPEVFPVTQIESEFRALVSLCRELPLPLGGNHTGYLDNLFVTPTGGLVLVEVKLWRNPEARRSAIAQAMEYAAAVFRMGYDELDAAVQKARAANGLTTESMFELVVRRHRDISEAEFHDAVSRNLMRGRAIVAVVGDGIREEMLSLASLIQGHAGHRFTFALVELAVYPATTQARIIVPSVLAQTVLIERGVVRVEGDGKQGLKLEITALPVAASSSGSGTRRISISEDQFFDVLGKKYPTMPDALRAFLEKAAALRVYPSFQGGLNLKHASPEGQAELNMGAIWKDGYVDTGPSTWFGRRQAGRNYAKTLADAIGGKVKESNGDAGVRTATGNMPRISDFLPQHEQLWLNAISRYIGQTGEPVTNETDIASDAEAQNAEIRSQEKLQQNAHERLWGQAGLKFVKPMAPSLDRSEPDDKA